MEMFFFDIVLCGVVYVILIYFIFRLMWNKRTDNRDDGGIFHLSPPEIDLPPGVSWPVNDPESIQKEKEEVFDLS